MTLNEQEKRNREEKGGRPISARQLGVRIFLLFSFLDKRRMVMPYFCLINFWTTSPIFVSCLDFDQQHSQQDPVEKREHMHTKILFWREKWARQRVRGGEKETFVKSIYRHRHADAVLINKLEQRCKFLDSLWLDECKDHHRMMGGNDKGDDERKRNHSTQRRRKTSWH